MPTAKGTFDVKITPQASDLAPEGPNLGRMSLDKQFHGDLSAAAKGEMITSAVERVSGTLHGKQGSFALQHTGVMNRGTPSLSITVVPDSATGELVGLTGKMNIIIEGKQHSYTFEYEIQKR